jgi:hypothetical protein
MIVKLVFSVLVFPCSLGADRQGSACEKKKETRIATGCLVWVGGGIVAWQALLAVMLL